MDKFTKLTDTGAVDISASSAAYTAALTDWVASNELDSDLIDTAVNAVFDRHNSVIPIATLVSMSVAELGASPSQFSAFSKRVHAYVRGQITAGNYSSKKGAGGGCQRTPSPSV